MDVETTEAAPPNGETGISAPEGFTRKTSAASDPKMYSEDDLAAARKQEKDKLYKRLETLQETVKTLEQQSQERAEAEEAQQREKQRQQEEAAKLAEQQREAEMSAKELLEKREAEWQAQLQAVQQQVEAERALREKETQYSQLMDFQNQTRQQYADRVAPELLDLIQGETPEAIQQSAEDMAARTQRILDQTTQAMQNARQQTPTARVSLPASGENQGAHQSFTAEEISAMSVSEFAKHRQRLLGQGADGPKNRGLFG